MSSWARAAAAIALIGALGCSKDTPPPASTADATTSAAPKAATSPPKVADLTVHTPETLIEAVKSSKARTTLVALWATWCAPCISEMPQLDHFAKAHAAKGLRVVGLCVDDRDELGDKIQDVLDQQEVSYPQALLKPGSEDALMKLIGEEWDGMLPKTVLFDADAKKLLFIGEALTESVLTAKVLPAIGK